MTQDVSPSRSEAVAGDFSGVIYRYGDVVARMHRDRAGQFLMSFSKDGNNRPAVDAVVVRAVGSRRYQQYLADVGGVLWRLPMAFHIEEKRWFHMNGAFLTPDPDPDSSPTVNTDAIRVDSAAHVANQAAPRPRFGGGDFDRHVTRWNDNCVFCHNVAPNPGRDAETGAFRTTVAELGIACEACHGPGGEHAKVNEDPVRRYLLHLSGAADPTIVNPSRLSAGRAADLCGRCHGQRISDDVSPFLAHGDPFVPGDDLALYTSPLWRDTPLGGDRGAFAERFWADGTPRLTAYEYQGLLQSACAQRGTLTCTTCHGMHDGDPRGQIRPSATGDRMCTVCHLDLAAPAGIAQHTHHDPAGPGARCVGCHMPRIVYGVLDVHPSHRIEIPDPAAAMRAGRPDACTLCHVEADRGWAMQARARLWPATSVSGMANPAKPANPLNPPTPGADYAPMDLLFGGDPIARAIAADALGRAPRAAGPSDRARAQTTRTIALVEAISGDRYPAVRHLASRALGRVLGSANSAATQSLRAFDATAPAAERQRVLVQLRKHLSSLDTVPIDADRISTLRASSRLVDIEIGE